MQREGNSWLLAGEEAVELEMGWKKYITGKGA